MPEFKTRPAYVVGLGGTGVSVLRLLKARYLEAFGSLPPTIRLLGIDTDSQNTRLPGENLETTEFLQIANFNGGDIVSHLEGHPEIAKWWRYGDAINPGYIDRGANALRPIGRLALFARFMEVYSRLATIIDEPYQYANQKLYPEKLRRSATVFVVCSLAGGTGTGLFLDLGVLLRHKFRELNLDTYINGIFALPSVFSNVVDQVTLERQRRNAYAALVELDYYKRCLGLGQPPNQFEYPLPLRTTTLTVSPYNWLYLCTNRDDQGAIYDRLDLIRTKMSQFIFASIALPIGENGASTLDNWKEADNASERTKNDVSAIYATFGVDAIVTPNAFIENFWAGELVLDVAKAIRDVNLFEVNRKNLDEKVTELASNCPKFAQLERFFKDPIERKAQFPFLSAQLETLGVPDTREEALQRVDDIRRDVETRLASFDFPDLTTGLKKALENWVVESIESVLEDPEFRLGGARRVASKILEKLSSYVQIPPGSPVTFKEIQNDLKQIKGWTARQRKENLQSKLPLAKQRLEELLDQQLLGRAAARLSDILRDILVLAKAWGKMLEDAQDKLVKAAECLVPSFEKQAKNSSGGVDSDDWHYTRDQIKAKLDTRREELVSKMALGIHKESGQQFAELVRNRSEEEKWQDLLRKALIPEIRKARRELLPRPPDVSQRIVKKLELCRPMCHYDQQELVRLQNTGLSPVPRIWLIASDNEGRDIHLQDELAKRGLDQEDENHSRPQIVDSRDPNRDDILIAQYGLPFYVISEVDDCRKASARATESEKLKTFIVPQHENVRRHDIFPPDPDKVKQLLAVPLVLGHIKPVGRTLRLNQEFFGLSKDSSDHPTWSERLREIREFCSARERLNRIEDWLVSQCETRGNRVVRTELLEAASRFCYDDWPEEKALQSEIRQMVEAAKAYASEL